MSVDQSFAVAMHAMSVMAFSEPDSTNAVFISEQISVHPVVVRRALRKLVNAGLVASWPGAKGGYRLTRGSDEIDLWDVFSAINVTGAFASRNAMPAANCEDGKKIGAVLTDIYEKADGALETELKKTTLALVLARAAGQ